MVTALELLFIYGIPLCFNILFADILFVAFYKITISNYTYLKYNKCFNQSLSQPKTSNNIIFEQKVLLVEEILPFHIIK